MPASPNAVTDLEHLHSLGGGPSKHALESVIDHIDPLGGGFIAASPFVIVSTCGADGRLDVSPRGDHVGFVQVLDEKTLAIPDRSGNGRFDTLQNLIDNPAIGLLFLVPGHGDTLRISGDGEIRTDPDLLARFRLYDRLPALVLRVCVKEVIFHCARCIRRSRLWQPEYWPDTAGLPSFAEAIETHIALHQRDREPES